MDQRRKIEAIAAAGSGLALIFMYTTVAFVVQRRLLALLLYSLDSEMDALDQERREKEIIARRQKRKREHEWCVRPKSSHFYGALLMPDLDVENFYKLFRVNRYVKRRINVHLCWKHQKT